MKGKINYWAIVVFYLIAILCRYLTNKTGILDGIANVYLKSILTGIGPALGAVAVFAIFKIKPKMTLKGNYKSLLLPMAIYWILPIALISIVTYFQKGTNPWIIILTTLIYGLFEEIGWRGFLYQQLKEWPLFVNILVLSTLWFLWHLNFEFTSSNLIFYGILILGSWGIGKVGDSTNSLLAVTAFHSLNNFFPNYDSTRIGILIVLLAVWISGLVIRKRLQKKTSANKGLAIAGEKS